LNEPTGPGEAQRDTREQAFKAAALSGLLFPGAGQLYNGQPWKGLLLILANVAALAAFVTRVWNVAVRSIPPDPTVLDPLQVLLLARDIQEKSAPTLAAPMAVLLLLWLYAVVDAYLGAPKR
jgi:hypothetical protein